MVPLWLLPAVALLVFIFAGCIAKLRRLGKRRVTYDVAAAVAAAAASVLPGICCYAIGAPLADGTVSRNAGAACFVAFPVLSAVVLRVAARKHGFGAGSVVGAFLLSLVAVVLISAWAILYLKGPRGGWVAAEILVFTCSVVLTFSAAACLGWWCGGPFGKPMPKLRIALILAASTACFIAHWATNGNGVLRLTIVDGETNRIVPARVALRDGSGEYIVPNSALALFGDCGKIPFHNWVPASAELQTTWGEYRGIRDPYRGSTDFYTEGTLTTRLRPGHYWMRVEKGPEYRTAEQEFVISADKEQAIRSVLRRWIDLPAEGWYSSDDHLHIPRPAARFDPVLAAWMQAEDIHVANLLQMGLARDIHLTPQRAFGPPSVYESGRTLLVGGQENPRTHIFGHSIILGGRNWIDFPPAYLLYDIAWREAHRQGAIAGYAHLGMAGAQDGLALWGQEHLIDFMEVLNLGFPYYQSWYDALNLGVRVVPTAGTDYPCLVDLPGRERFYAKLDGTLTFPGWIDAVRRGRTFVTNGPALEFFVDGSMIGDELAFEAPSTVKVRARVRFDASRERVDRLEIVRAGQVVATARQPVGGEITLNVAVTISASTWLAARISGEKVGERPAGSVEPFARYVSRLKRKADANVRETLEIAARPKQTRISAAHTAPVYIQVHGTPSISEQGPAREVAKAYLDLLDDLVTRLDDARLGDMARFPGAGDGVTSEDLRRSRADLLQAVQKAREQYRRIIQPGGK